MAASTWLALTLPDEQAEPALTITPARSSRHELQFARKPGAATHRVLGRRGAASPMTTAPAAFSFARGGVAPGGLVAARSISQRRARPRRSRRCRDSSRCRPGGRAPGRRRAGGATAWRAGPKVSAPTPCGPPILWAETLRVSAPRARLSTGILPAAWTASTCSQPSAARTISERGLAPAGSPRSRYWPASGRRRVCRRRRPSLQPRRQPGEVGDAVARRPA